MMNSMFLLLTGECCAAADTGAALVVPALLVGTLSSSPSPCTLLSPRHRADGQQALDVHIPGLAEGHLDQQL